MRRPSSLTLILCVALATGGCAAATGTGTGTAGTTTNSSIISAAEIESHGATGSAAELVRAIRPQWMASRGRTNFGGTAGSTLISVDGGALQSLDGLDQTSAKTVKELRLLSGTEATQRFGTGSYGGAVILITHK
jgi:hypothetical protein